MQADKMYYPSSELPDEDAGVSLVEPDEPLLEEKPYHGQRSRSLPHTISWVLSSRATRSTSIRWLSVAPTILLVLQTLIGPTTESHPLEKGCSDPICEFSTLNAVGIWQSHNCATLPGHGTAMPHHQCQSETQSHREYLFNLYQKIATIADRQLG